MKKYKDNTKAITPKVSVIIPSLNAGPYIDEAISSVLNQTIYQIEIICVDAGSTDGTLEIIKKHMKQDPRIIFLQSKIKSYGCQMNMGIGRASGEYVGIVEADDYVPKQMYGELYDIAASKDLDIIKADFYRFTGTGDSLNEIYFALTERQDLYRRVFEPAKEQGSMLTVNNTWCGIYRRKFLIDNDIRHHESPGASFQDNGFFFQTMMHARRVYFYNRAYYRNRRDNPGSSVFCRNKIYCICDEYGFIRGKLIETDMMKIYRDTYNVRLFMEYYGNLGRLRSSDKLEFMHRFAEDFRNLQRDGDMDITAFDEVRSEQLKGIMEDPDTYWRIHIRPYDEVFDKAEEYQNIIIYGAASVGWFVLHSLLGRGKGSNIICFAVTKKKPGQNEIYGYPVRQIDHIVKMKDEAVVVIAAKSQYRPAMRKTAGEMGFSHILEIPEPT